MSNSVRVRFAPSPTGPLHIGGLRTALYNYLFSKKHNGTFILRIEDTDQKRYVEGAENYIINALKWCGIRIDEGPQQPGKFGPYRQSSRNELYKTHIKQLVDSGKAYYAFDTEDELNSYREEHELKGKTFIYNWHNRLKLNNSLVLTDAETKARLEAKKPYVIRFKAPEDESLTFTDEIRGEITVNTSILDDKVLFKSDGTPTYHLANIVDDHLMKISHVIRGEEWLPSLPLHVLLYQAFGWEAPKFAHLPLLLKPTGKGKLSKRDGDKLGFPVFPLEWTDPKTGVISKGYKEDGYFPETVVNFLAFLGWNPGTEQELFSMEELSQAFNLDQVHKSGARFDPDKTKWFNHQYMQKQKNSVLAKQFKAQQNTLKDVDLNYIESVVDMVKERATFVSEFWCLSYFFFEKPSEYDEKAFKKAIKPNTATILEQALAQFEIADFNTISTLQNQIKAWITSNNIGFGNVMMPLRLALVGALEGPDVFNIAFLIGKQETTTRIKNLIQAI